ncbi:MAG TPA: hypothetical protein VNM16_01735 [Bacillota bacterium]|nr:hypothetical protein [Bacillota bacterium]
MKRWLLLWWVALGLTLAGLMLQPLQFGAFAELALVAGAAFVGLRILGPRARRFPDLRWFAALTAAVAVAMTATSVVWASPLPLR